MSALAKVQIIEEVAKSPIALVEPSAEVLIHVRFQPNADIFTIDAQPKDLAPKAWFEKLYMTFPQHYRTLANGRGFFRIPRDAFEAAV